MPDHPLAYLLSFRTYGTWLHGDERGSMDRRHNLHGCRRRGPDEGLLAWRKSSLRQPPVVFDVGQRRIVEATLAEVSSHRGWTLYASNARTNHVHAVVEALAIPERMLVDFKAWSTRRLVERGGVAPGAPVWSRHGSTCYLWRAEAVESACHYVVHGQEEGEPQPDGIDPWSEEWHAGEHAQVVPPV